MCLLCTPCRYAVSLSPFVLLGAPLFAVFAVFIPPDYHYLTSPPPLFILQRIRGLTLDLEEKTELFSFNAQGSHHVSLYLDEQIERIAKVKKEISEQISNIGDYLQLQHDTLTSESYLREDIMRVHDNHPFLPAGTSPFLLSFF